MRIAIIGAGFTGLTAAHRLCQKGHQVTIFEKENQVGGLASGFREKDWQWHLENFFHHLFVSDKAAKDLITGLGLSQKLFFPRPKTSIFYKGKIAQFDSALSVLSFPYLSLSEKLRTGLVTAYLKLLKTPREFEKITAEEWLKKYYGEKSYQIIWYPLLQGKFAQFADQIPMSWFWARIKKRSPKLGYIEGGFQVLINKLVEKIKKNNGQIILNKEVSRYYVLKHSNKFDRIIFTTPTSIFLKILQNTSDGGRLKRSESHDSSEVKKWWKKLQKLKMLGALNLILVLKKKFLADGTYWLNINESDFPFVAVVEHTNLIDPKYYDGNHLVYVGGYYPQNHRYFKMKKEEIFKEFLPYLQKINPNSKLLITNYYLLKNRFAQPIIPINYSRLIPSFKTPVPKVFLANMQMVYPWDRGINYAIEEGEKVANEVLKDI